MQKTTFSKMYRERISLLYQLDEWLELPMAILGFIWLALLVTDLIWGSNRVLALASSAIWIVFIIDFVVKITLAPRKLRYIRRNWLTVIALVLPALRVLRILKIVRAARGLRLIRILSSLNRGLRAIRASMKRRGLGYVVILTMVITIVGAAGMYAFESNLPNGRGLNDYGTALWWTSMIMTTMGSEYWPRTLEGRILCLILALYAFTVFGYVTASIATLLIDRDAKSNEAEIAGAKDIQALHTELSLLKKEVQVLTAMLQR